MRKEDRMSRTERLEKSLTEAVKDKRKAKARTFISRLHKLGVHEGFAMEAGRKFIQTG